MILVEPPRPRPVDPVVGSWLQQKVVENMLEQKPWRDYEDVAQFLLGQMASHFELGRVEGKQVVAGAGTTWEVDAKGVLEDDEGFVVIECKRHTKQGVSQAIIGALSCIIQDTGAVGGIIVSPLPLQTGSKNLAKSKGIVEVQLYENSTTTCYVLQFLNKIFVGLSHKAIVSDYLEARVIHSSESPSGARRDDEPDRSLGRELINVFGQGCKVR